MHDPTSEVRTWQDIKNSCGVEDEDQLKYLASKNFEFFIEHVLGLNTDSPVIQKSIDFHQNPEKYKETDEHMDSVKAAIMAPRGHSKTFSWTIAPILWVCFSEHGKEIILSSASHTQSKDILKDIKRIIKRNEMLQHLESSTENLEELDADISSEEGAWNKEEITTTTDVQVNIKTFSDSIRSSHVDYVFLDDVLSNDMKVEKEKEVFYSTLTPIVENSGGLLQIVGTPLEYNDLMMELMDKDSFYSERYRAYDPETKEVLWPALWSYDSLMEKKAEIGPGKFEREYMTSPMSIDEQFFSNEMIESSLGSDWMHNPNKEERSNWMYVLGVDIALSDSKDADYTVFTVLGVAPSGETHLVNLQRERGMSPTSIADKIDELDEFYGFSKGLVEKNAIGEGVWKTIKNKCRVTGRVEPFDTTRKTRPEILSSLQAGLNRGELLLHSHDALMREMRGFHMNSKGKLVGREHDDTVMSLAIAYRCVDGGGVDSSMSIIGGEENKGGNEEGVDGIVGGDSGSGRNDFDLGIV